jgi:hypothetical protein
MVDLLKAWVPGFEYVGSHWCEESMKCVQSVLGFVPALALTSISFVLPVPFYSIVVGTGFETLLDLQQLNTAFPSKDTLRNWILEYAIDCLVEIGNCIKGKSVFLACDEGNKKRVGHFVKIISWWDKQASRVRSQLIDSHESEGTSEGCAKAIDHSISWALDRLQGGGILSQVPRKLLGQA